MPRRARLHQTGFDTPLTLEDFALPTPGPGQIVLQVEACGVCHRDLIDRDGRFPWLALPITPGHEAAGTVIAVGPDSVWRVGDRVATLHRDHCGDCASCARGQTSLCVGALWVFGLVVDGGYATHLLANDASVYANSLPAEQGCFLHCTVGTAWRGLVRQGLVQAGDRVAVVGANGGVGRAALQVAQRLGCQTVAITRRPCGDLGADQHVVSPENAFHKKIGMPADIVLDCVGSPTFNASLRSLRMGGRLVVIGNISAERAAFNLGYAIVNGLHVVGSSGATADDMAEVLALHQQSPFDLQALVDRALPLSEAEAAQQAVRSGGLTGRIVLRTQS